jgi:hypothetical protein
MQTSVGRGAHYGVLEQSNLQGTQVSKIWDSLRFYQKTGQFLKRDSPLWETEG